MQLCFVPATPRTCFAPRAVKSVGVCNTSPATLRKGVVATARTLRPVALSRLIPTWPSYQQFRLHIGSTSTIVDRILTSILSFFLLYLLPASRLIQFFKFLSLLYPLLHPLFQACHRNARLRLSSHRGVLICGELRAIKTGDHAVIGVVDSDGRGASARALRVNDQKVAALDGQPAYALVLDERVVHVWCVGTAFYEYPFVRRQAFETLCEAFESQ